MKAGEHKGSIEHRFGGRKSIIVPAGTRKDLPALSWPCFENRCEDCSGKCLPLEPQTDCEHGCHRRKPA